MTVRLRPYAWNVRMLNDELFDTLLYGCVTWGPSEVDCDRLRKVHHQMLF